MTTPISEMRLKIHDPAYLQNLTAEKTLAGIERDIEAGTPTFSGWQGLAKAAKSASFWNGSMDIDLELSAEICELDAADERELEEPERWDFAS